MKVFKISPNVECISGYVKYLLYLFAHQVAEGFMLGSVCVYFQADAVLIAVGICAFVTLGLTLFAFQVSQINSFYLVF